MNDLLVVMVHFARIFSIAVGILNGMSNPLKTVSKFELIKEIISKSECTAFKTVCYFDNVRS